MAYVVVSVGGEEVSRQPIEGTTVIGRSVDSGIAVRDASMSRWHCRIERDEETDQWVAIDLGSRNGTTLNGRRVVRQVLRDGDLLRMGRVTVYFAAGQFVPALPRPTVPLECARPRVPVTPVTSDERPSWNFDSRLPRPLPGARPSPPIDYDQIDIMSSPGWSRQLRKPPSPCVAADTERPDEPEVRTLDLAVDDQASHLNPTLGSKLTRGLRSIFGR
jgi:hypothetical protein